MLGVAQSVRLPQLLPHCDLLPLLLPDVSVSHLLPPRLGAHFHRQLVVLETKRAVNHQVDLLTLCDVFQDVRKICETLDNH